MKLSAGQLGWDVIGKYLEIVLLPHAMTQMGGVDAIKCHVGAMSLSGEGGPKEGSRNMICRW
jgi:hypothetical protein